LLYRELIECIGVCSSSHSFLRIFFVLAAIATSSSMIDERKSGVWSRAIVAGVKPSQFLVSHLIEGFVIMLVQFIELSVYILCFLLPPLTWKATGLLLLIFLTTGIAGIVFGVLISLVAHDVSVAMHINQSFTKITIFICGESSLQSFPVENQHLFQCFQVWFGQFKDSQSF
jgi:hypothetical protein